MKISKSKKLEILWQNHNEAYNKARNEAIEEMDNITPIFCVCGKLATGLHTSRCRKFNDRVDSIIINKIGHLLEYSPSRLNPKNDKK